jgi:DNA mismatch repair protein MutL
LEKENIEQIFLWIIEDIAEYNSWKSTNLEEVKKKILAFTACRSAIKFWNRLSFFEINKLIEESQNFYSSTCPHGRPVIFEMSLGDLKNLFER